MNAPTTNDSSHFKSTRVNQTKTSSKSDDLLISRVGYM